MFIFLLIEIIAESNPLSTKISSTIDLKGRIVYFKISTKCIGSSVNLFPVKSKTSISL